jgi:recombination protein RecT
MTTGTDLAQRGTQQPALVGQLEELAPQLEHLGVDPARFKRLILNEAQKNRTLLECTPASFIGAVFTSAQLGLEPGPLQQCFLIPRNNRRRGVKEVQWLLGYPGMVELARRVGVIVHAGIVHANDRFEERQGSDPHLEHVPNHLDPGEAILWYAVARFPDGRSIHRVLNKAEVERRRKMSSTPYKPGSPWYDHYDAMARKTAIRALWSDLPADPMLQRAAALDEQVLEVSTVGSPSAGRPGLAAPTAVTASDDGGDGGEEQAADPPQQQPAADAAGEQPTLHQLRDRCRELGLSRQGSRDELIARIRDAEAAEDVDGQVEAEGRDDVPPMPPPPDDPDGPAPPAAAPAGEEAGPSLRDRMVAALRTIGAQHPQYADVWHRMVALVPEHRLDDGWDDADQVALGELVAEVEELAAEVEADA